MTRGRQRAALVVVTLLAAPTAALADPIHAAWPQPGGPGSPLTLIYSYSNLFDGSFKLLTERELRAATEEALWLWSAHAPIFFVEQVDAGPPPGDTAYPASSHPQIRIGHHPMDDLGHAFFPSVPDGLAGDVHIAAGVPWTLGVGRWNFLEVVTHELGHALGLPHIDDQDSVMNSLFPMPRFGGLGTGLLLPAEILALQAFYGAGSGAVSPLQPIPEPATLLLTGGGLALLLRRRVTRRLGVR